MPSSLLFAGLVATWLAVLVPMAARRRQQTPRPSDAVLSSRVLERPRRRNQEVTTMDDAEARRSRTGPEVPDSPHRHLVRHRRVAHLDQGSYDERADDEQLAHDQHADDELDGRDGSHSVAPRYREGRGGYNAEAAALAAQAKYTFRQRMVVVLVLFAVISAVLAGTLRMTDAWYLHAAVDLSLVGYLIYLRRQVRMEQAIRARRAARMAGSRGAVSGDFEHHDDRVRRARPAGRRTTVAEAVAAREAARAAGHGTAGHGDGATGDGSEPDADEDAEAEQDRSSPEDGYEDGYEEDDAEQEPALPRLKPVRLPAPPPGTVRLELDAEDPELHDLVDWQPRGYRRAAGQ